MHPQADRKELQKRIAELEKENNELKKGLTIEKGKTVSVPEHFAPLFVHAQKVVGEYFEHIEMRPSQGTIQINEERYVLVRASALSTDFFQKIIDLYADRGKEEAILIGRNFLFDIAHLIGQGDARNLHKVMNVKDPFEKLSTGPVHFAYSGWAHVDILPESRPSPDDNFFLKFRHPFSFEADCWIHQKKVADFPACIMNAGFSSGWGEASFGIPLTTVEISCRAKGDEHCTFIMAPPHKINEYLETDISAGGQNKVYDVPMFFERKQAEEKIRASLLEKEILLKEIHHRVKNNLQIISSLLKLQSGYIDHPELNKIITDSQGRIKTMAIVHEKLYLSNLGSVDIGDYLETVAEFTKQSLTQSGKQIVSDLKFCADLVKLKIDQAIPIGLIVNEVLTNSFKYAFKGRSNGWVSIKTHKNEKEQLCLTVSDNGIGFPEGIDFMQTESFGMELIRMLTDQLDGTVQLKSENGITYSFVFPIEE